MSTETTRRDFLLATMAPALLSVGSQEDRHRQHPIDRATLVRRHNIVVTTPDLSAPCQVGNGEFAVTVDVTGLQTFAEDYEAGMPLGTMAQWAWHRFPTAEPIDLADVSTDYDSHGRPVAYADGKVPFAADAPPSIRSAAVRLRVNPHRIHLGRVGLLLRDGSGLEASLSDIVEARQELDLWTGTLESRFHIFGAPVAVTTVCHPSRDVFAVSVRSALLTRGLLRLGISFPYAAGEWGRAADWNAPARHTTTVITGPSGARFKRVLDATRYEAAARWSDGTTVRATAEHRFELAADRDRIELVLAFAPESTSDVPAFDETRRVAAEHWGRFWTTGGAIDFADSDDPRAPELERRVVLSQYVTAVNCAGSMPPQETGLVTNSWYGKHHLEMHWWHAAHFALWNRSDLLERSMPWYQRILPQARDLATRQGYRGARWPKQVGDDGRQSPSGVGVFLIWQQPHPIYLAELLYRSARRRDILERYEDLVFQSAEFMASYAWWDARAQRYVLGPPLVPAQESYANVRQQVINPTFELAYWWWGLKMAQRWRERLGRAREPRWDHVIAHLARPTVRDGVYTAIEVEPFTRFSDHPSMLAALGFVPPTPLVDASTMRQTLARVWTRWDWPTTWGWDYPMMAITAARLGDTDRAVDALLMRTPKNQYLPNGHNFQTAGRLPLYLPGNGGLLYATAMMAAGWDDGPGGPAPGFPRRGWRVRAEGLTVAP
jgi:hypothetical protein